MKTHFVCSIVCALAIFGAANAGTPQDAAAPKVKSKPSNTKSSARKSAPAKPAVAQFQRREPGPRWTWRRIAMQPFRFIVIAAKIPCSLAGYPIIASHSVLTCQHVPDPGEFFANFDPGPAIDADLEGYGPLSIPTQEYAPEPIRTTVRPLNATSAVEVHHISICAYWSAPLPLTGSGSDFGPDLSNFGLDPKVTSHICVSGPLLDTRREQDNTKRQPNSFVADSDTRPMPVSAEAMILSQR
jgi:hypothetical protein